MQAANIKEGCSPRVVLYTLWRSGTHWMGALLSGMLGMPWQYDALVKDYADCFHDAQRRPRVLTQHFNRDFSFSRTLLSSSIRHNFKVVQVYRDPRDVIVSNIHMRKYVEGYREGLPPFPDMALEDIFWWEWERQGEFYRTILPQWVALSHENMIKVSYERLKGSTLGELKRVADFLELDIPEENLASIVDENSFAKKAKRKPGEEDKKSIYRKGVTGDYRNFFSPEIVEMLDSELDACLRVMKLV